MLKHQLKPPKSDFKGSIRKNCHENIFICLFRINSICCNFRNLALILPISLITTHACAESLLPSCPLTPQSQWNNCVGVSDISTGSKYVGEFRGGALNGRGRWSLPSGGVYEGEFKDNEMSGQGVLNYPNGDNYTGEMKHNKRNGWGTLKFSDGDKYVGNWSNDSKNGKGTYFFKSGDKYLGEFDNDEMQGYGTYYTSDGNKHDEGMWRHNNPIRK